MSGELVDGVVFDGVLEGEEGVSVVDGPEVALVRGLLVEGGLGVEEGVLVGVELVLLEGVDEVVQGVLGVDVEAPRG